MPTTHHHPRPNHHFLQTQQESPSVTDSLLVLVMIIIITTTVAIFFRIICISPSNHQLHWPQGPNLPSYALLPFYQKQELPHWSHDHRITHLLICWILLFVSWLYPWICSPHCPLHLLKLCPQSIQRPMEDYVHEVLGSTSCLDDKELGFTAPSPSSFFLTSCWLSDCVESGTLGNILFWWHLNVQSSWGTYTWTSISIKSDFSFQSVCTNHMIVKNKRKTWVHGRSAI